MTTYTILNKRIREKDLPNFTRQLFKNRQKDRREKMTEVSITKEEIQAYEDCRQQGNYNMFDLTNVGFETGLSRDKLLFIMKNYSRLMEEFGIERG